MTGGVVFDIQRFSLQDGPGLRTLVFLKGCPLRCAWCSNPESQRPDPQLFYDGDRCTLCLKCVPTCASGALTTAGEGSLSYDLTLCTKCGACVAVCPNAARSISGKQMSVDEVLAAVLRDAPFYRRSGGGVTLGEESRRINPTLRRPCCRLSNSTAWILPSRHAVTLTLVPSCQWPRLQIMSSSM